MKLKSAHQILPALTTQHTPALTTCSDKWLHTHINTGKKNRILKKNHFGYKRFQEEIFLKSFSFLKERIVHSLKKIKIKTKMPLNNEHT